MQVGTLEYMAPEVLLKQPYGLSADIYALAVTMNELATRGMCRNADVV